MATILVVEDEGDIRELLVVTLRFYGHEVYTGCDGEEALPLTRQTHPELILMDVRMPNLDGYAACRQIRSDPSTSHTPVVFITARGQDAEVAAGYETGAEGYILKPFSPVDLVRDVEKHLHKAVH